MTTDDAPAVRAAPTTAPLIVTADATLLDHALVAVTAAGLEADVAHEVGSGRIDPAVDIVLIGADLATRWLRLKT